MGKALIGACDALGLKVTEDATGRMLAARIIDHAKDGIRDIEQLKAAALSGLKKPEPPRHRSVEH